MSFYNAIPDWLVKGKWILLVYFCINLLIITMSTTRVSMDLMEPMERVRYLIAFILPWEMPQLLSLGPVPDWMLSLAKITNQMPGKYSHSIEE